MNFLFLAAVTVWVAGCLVSVDVTSGRNGVRTAQPSVVLEPFTIRIFPM